MNAKDKELVDMVNNRIREIEWQKLKEIQEHKCFNCDYGTWTGSKFFCILPRCLKGLRNIYYGKKV